MRLKIVSAEVKLRDAKRTLLEVEEAIRERLLNEKLASVEKQNDLAV
jgi:hypothetical protein